MRSKRKKTTTIPFFGGKKDKMHKQGVLEIQYNQITLEEAMYRLQIHDGGGWFDADKQAMVLVE